MSDEASCRAAYETMYAAMVAKDLEALKAVLGEDFVLVHMTGMRQDRAQFIRAVKDGTLNYYTCRHEHVAVTVRGDSAALQGRSLVSAAVFGGGRHTWRLMLDCALKKREGGWRITRAEAGTY